MLIYVLGVLPYFYCLVLLHALQKYELLLEDLKGISVAKVRYH